MIRVTLALALALCGTVAWAADKPAYGPPPAWVKPAAAPVKPDHLGTADTRRLLNDVQARISPEGQEFYTETATLVQAPAGLQSVGTIAAVWDPALDTLTIHKLQVIRDGKILDLLAGPSPFTVFRRESNLERAVLDGRLTAAAQPPGLQVGDIVDFAVTVKRLDPALQGRGSVVVAGLTGGPTDRMRVRALWAKGEPVRWRESADLPKGRVSKLADGTELVIEGSDIQGAVLPAGAPSRYGRVGMVELTDLTSWSEISTIMLPLYAKAAELAADSPLKAEAARIRAASADPKRQAAAALRLVQDDVRYLELAMDGGGYTPASADLTWSRRFGDCKGKTVLLLALLRELGIEAEPAIVSVANGDGLEERPPMPDAFDHVIVRASIAGRTYWLDGTRRGDVSLDLIQTPPFRWALPVRAAGAELVALPLRPLDRPLVNLVYAIDASAGLTDDATIRAEARLGGDTGATIRYGLDQVPPERRDEAIRAFWKASRELKDITSVSATFDEATGEMKLTAEGKVATDWAAGDSGGRRLYVRDAHLFFTVQDRAPGAPADAPYVTGHPTYIHVLETIALPAAGAGFTVSGPDLDKTYGGSEFKRVSKLDKGVFKTELSARTLVPEVTAAEARAAEDGIGAIDDVYIQAPARLAATAAAGAKGPAPTPGSALEHATKGEALWLAGETDKGLAEVEQALVQDPNLARALATRGMIRIAKDDLKGAEADLERAAQLAPDLPTAAFGQGQLWMRKGQPARALPFFDRGLRIDPNNEAGFVNRAMVHQSLGQTTAAFADLNRALEINSDYAWAYAQRGMMRLQTGDLGAASADAEKAISLNSRIPLAYVIRALILVGQFKTAEALADVDRALKLDPADSRSLALRGRIELSLNRRDQAKADFDRSLELLPDNAAALKGRAALQMSGGDAAGAVQSLSRVADVDPELLVDRAAGYVALAKPDLARADLDAALKQAPKSFQLLMQIAGLRSEIGDVEGALKILDEAAALAPSEPSIPRLRSDIYARAERYDEAGEALEAVVALTPNDPDLLNNRCWFRAVRGKDLAKALADCDAAVAAAPQAAAPRDSRGLVQLKLAHFDRSIADYDAALKLSPGKPASLYGRGLARIRMGAVKAGQSDLAAARRASPSIDKTFEGYGLKP